VSGDFAASNVGRKITDIVDVSRLIADGQLSLWWNDENGDYQVVPYSFVREDMSSVGGRTTRVLVVSHTGISAGYWGVGESRSKGQTTRTFQFDKSTGVLMASRVEGSYSYQRSRGGWQETLQGDSKVTSVRFDLGDYVLIDSDPGAIVTVDGSDLQVADQPKLFVWEWDSSHTIAAPSIVDISNDTRLVFTSWNDGNTNQTRTILADKAGTYVAEFKTQYMLNIQSPYGNPLGSGWYDEGSSVNVHIDSSYAFVFVFVGWSGDLQSETPDVTVTMNGPKTLRANWLIDYVRLAILIGTIAATLAGFFFYRRKRSRRLGEIGFEPSGFPFERISTGRFCISCGTAMRPHDRFCRRCGATQP